MCDTHAYSLLARPPRRRRPGFGPRFRPWQQTSGILRPRGSRVDMRAGSRFGSFVNDSHFQGGWREPEPVRRSGRYGSSSGACWIWEMKLPSITSIPWVCFTICGSRRPGSLPSQAFSLPRDCSISFYMQMQGAGKSIALKKH